MSYRGTVLAALLLSLALIAVLPATPHSNKPSHLEITPAAAGPFHVFGNQLIDASGRPFLMRGTQLPGFPSLATGLKHDEFGPYTPTSLTAIRLRFNMNTVRLPVAAARVTPQLMAGLRNAVRNANDADLLVVLAADDSAGFWTPATALFKTSPNVIFEVASAAGLRELRAAGWQQPVVVPGSEPIPDPNVIYRIAPSYPAIATSTQRDRQFAGLAHQVPVLVTGLDVDFNNVAACRAFPDDPSALESLVNESLRYFDAQQISWTISEYAPGKLVKEASTQDATSLENGWTCGQPAYPPAGIGRLLEAHLRAGEERGMFVVSSAGGPDLPRGGYAVGYGPVMAQQDAVSGGALLPKTLAGITVQITDSLGATRPSGILWVSAGWGQVNYVIPPESALGPARMTLLRSDGSSLVANITIADTAPGFRTAFGCRGPALGTATRISQDGRTSTSQLSSCQGYDCKTLPVPVGADAKTRVQLIGSGFRNALSAADIEMTIGGVRVSVVSYGPSNAPGIDQVTVEIPAALAHLGQADVLCHIHGRVSNAVQVRLGAA